MPANAVQVTHWKLSLLVAKPLSAQETEMAMRLQLAEPIPSKHGWVIPIAVAVIAVMTSPATPTGTIGTATTVSALPNNAVLCNKRRSFFA